MGPRYQQNPNIEAAPLQDEVLLLNPLTSKFCTLNSTSSFIWSQLQRPATAEQISEEISRNFEGIDKAQAIQDVNSVLREMVGLGLISSSE
jgi:hypothetical protein